MNKSLLIILTIILNSLLIKGDTRQCGEESINNCQVCGKYETYDSCGTCEANHFPLMENLLCMACNDPIYGQVGCKGDCDGKDYSTTSFAFCDNCLDGYYSLNGICTQCNEGSPAAKNVLINLKEMKILKNLDVKNA